MNTKLFNGILLAGGLLVGGAASAGTFSWTGSVADWAATGATGITTTDGDITFTYQSVDGNFSGLSSVALMVTLSEIEISGVDYYDVGFDFSKAPGLKYDGGGSILYSLTAHNLLIGNMLLDTVKVGTGTELIATKELFDLGVATPFLTLTSTDGSNTGYTSFNPRSYIEVKDTYGTATGASFQDSHNNFSLIPEPESLSLFGIGLAALGFSRRRTA